MNRKMLLMESARTDFPEIINTRVEHSFLVFGKSQLAI